MKRLIDNIPAQVIEPMIVRKLPQLFTSQTAWLMDGQLAAEIAGESEAKQQLRTQYNAKLVVLQAGEATCKRYCDGLMIGKLIRSSMLYIAKIIR